MRQKFSFLFLLAAMAFAMQTAWAMDEADDGSDEAAVEVDAMDDDALVCPRGYSHWDEYGHRSRWHRGGSGMGHSGHGRSRGGMNCAMNGGSDSAFSGMGRGMRYGGGRGMLGMRVLATLDLDDAQKAKIVDLLTNNYRERLLTRLELQNAVRTLRGLDEVDAPDNNAIIEANQALGAARGKMDVLGRKLRTDILAVLTPEQRKALEERDQRPARRDGDAPRGGRRSGGGMMHGAMHGDGAGHRMH